MMQTNLALALRSLIARRGITASQLAAETRLNQSTISRLLSDPEKRLDVPTLRALCQLQTDREDGLEILFAHLRDETERAGFTQGDVSFTSQLGQGMHDDITVLAAEMRGGNAELIALIRDMAQLARNYRRSYPENHSDHPDLKVAEE
jgi:transcriptional regulator with XRE-family HTH domain